VTLARETPSLLANSTFDAATPLSRACCHSAAKCIGLRRSTLFLRQLTCFAKNKGKPRTKAHWRRASGFLRMPLRATIMVATTKVRNFPCLGSHYYLMINS